MDNSPEAIEFNMKDLSDIGRMPPRQFKQRPLLRI